MKGAVRFLPAAIVVALVAAGAFFFLRGGDDTKTLTAYFPRTVSVYEGSDVRVLGVPVGQVEEVTPEGTEVKVVMRYDSEVKVPADATAVIVSPSVVGDRYVQLTPAYESGPVIEDQIVLPTGRTAVPLELDEIYSSLDRLTVALGPNGANEEGALTDLLEQTAKNFGGQGAQFRQTIQDFGRLSGTLEDNKEELFDSAAQLQTFIETLAENDTTVRDFNVSLGEVSALLADEREELTAALSNLGVALEQVGTFVEENRDVLSRNIFSLNRVAKVLVKQRAAMDEFLTAGPLAYNNLALTYNPQSGTLDTNANLGNLVDEITSDPAAVICALLSSADPDGNLCNLLDQVGLPRSGPFGAGTGSWADDVYDPSLSGLVEVDR
ncbi:MAG TPA: MCE family protein [Nocardioides sp.]|nr:MCE family protein [Nocardioides sp.]